MYMPPAPSISTSTMVMRALPTTTNGLRARSDRLGGGGSCSGSSAARGLRGEMGGLSLIDTTQILSVNRGPAKAAASALAYALLRIYHRTRRNGGYFSTPQ